MVCEEASTATRVKEIIVQTPGVKDEAQWDASYEGEAGGIMTVQNELGEPIHTIATRGVRLWREFDREIFNVPVKDRQLAKKKEYIIRRLNADFQKVYFGRKTNDSGEVCDIVEMTYAEVLTRFVELCYIPPEQEVETKHHEQWTPQGRWIDSSYQTRLETWLHRCETRVRAGHASSLRGMDLTRPMETVRTFLARFPELEDTLLTTEDTDVFIHLCQTGKPVPFIPIIDHELEMWFKKDCLWYSEDLAAVSDHDAQRVCILQGPVSVAYSTMVNEPVGQILEKMCEGWIAALEEGEAEEEEVEIDFSTFPEVRIHEDTITMWLPERNVPEEGLWRRFLGGKEESWMKALLTSSILVRRKQWAPNILGRLFKPRASQKVELFRSSTDATLSTLRVFAPASEQVELDARLVENVVTVTIYDVRPMTADAPQEIVPLRLRATYHPDQPRPLHELDPIEEIKQYYQMLWFAGGNPEADLKATHEAAFSITQHDVDAFNAAIFSSPSDKSSTTLDFCSVAAWKPLITCLFPEALRGNMLDLVHLSNSYTVLGAKSSNRLRVGDCIHSAVRVEEIANTPHGIMVRCAGTLTREGEPIVHLTSSFLFRGSCTDIEFKRYDRVAVLELDETRWAILQSKDWFQPTENLRLGDRLEFSVHFASAAVSGVVRRASTQVGSIQSESGSAVAGFLDRWEDLDQPVLFANGGYRVLAQVDVVTTPASNIPYAVASRDLNPMHRNAYVAEIAGLEPIVHEMWLSANARRVVEVVGGSSASIKSYCCDFERTAFAGEKLYTHVSHVGNKNGRKMVTVQTCNAAADTVLKGRAEIDFPMTAFVFTGQGSQEVGMGMDLYARSKHARAVWDEAESHMLDVYGISILDIVRNNPQAVTVHFGGRKGAVLRRTYMELTRVGPDGTEPLIPSITTGTMSYTFHASSGLLHATQFTQPALTLMEIAIYEDMHAHGLIPPGHLLAGHSLGEYAALVAIGRVLSIKQLVEVVFLRGLTMQHAVPRNDDGQSEYGMIAVNPMRLGNYVSEQQLKDMVDLIEAQTQLLVQIVNYNVRGMQYIVAGKVQALVILESVLNALDAGADATNAVALAVAEVEERMLRGVLTLKRGKATIPLPGVDVPFHSKFLLPGVDNFRRTLEEHLNCCHPDVLVGRFLPNVTASPFSLSRSYVSDVWDITGSHKLAAVLEDWPAFASDRIALSRTLLIELLAFQFACPVRWIETQDYFFTTGRVQRVIEIGPTATLKTMALRTLATGAYGVSPRSILHCAQDRDEAYCALSDLGPSCEDTAKADRQASEKATPIAPTAIHALSDSPVTALESLQVLLALKLRTAISNVSENATIKALCGGKSALQNEILADIDKECGKVPANAEISLAELATSFRYKALGKVAMEHITKMMSAKMPAGFGLRSAKQYLADAFRLGPGRTESVLFFSVLVGPESRLGSDREAHAWLDRVVQSYAKKANIKLAKVGAPLAMASPMPIEDVPVSAAEFIKMVLALKLKVPLASISESRTLKDLTGGKSALQNEILCDVRAELGISSDAAGNVPICELTRHFPTYAALGNTSHTWLAKLISAKMAASFSLPGMQTYLAEQWLLPPGRINRVLLHALTMEPELRLDDEGSKKWLDSVVEAFSTLHHLVLPQASAIAHGPLFRPKELEALQKRLNRLVEFTVDSQLEFLNVDKLHAVHGLETEMLLRSTIEKELEQWITEHGEFYRLGITPMFRASMQRTYDSYWNWSRVEVLRLYHAWLLDGEPLDLERIRRIENRASKELLDIVAVLSDTDCDPSLKQFLEHLASGVAQKMGAPACQPIFTSLAPRTVVRDDGEIVYEEIPRPGIACTSDYIAEMQRGFHFTQDTTRKSHQRPTTSVPYLFVETSNPKQPTRRMIDDEASEDYFQAMQDLEQQGISLQDKVVVVTGCGVDSIGLELMKYLLQAGAHVIATTSSFTYPRTKLYRAIYEEHCGAGSSLTVLPFNQASAQDVTALVSHLYDSMGVDVDFVVPFAAISENGSDISDIEGRSELSHRIMLTNTIRLLGAIKAKKEERNIVTRPAVAYLPLSPHYGLFGHDGLYVESKLGLEALLAKSVTEGWSDYLAIVGVVLGWTRGTGLTSGNNIVAESLEAQGLRTFSRSEMAFNLLALFHPSMVALSCDCPVVVNIAGGISMVPDLHHVSMTARAQLFARAALKKRVTADMAADEKFQDPSTAWVPHVANFKSSFPPLPTAARVRELSNLHHMMDLEKVVVCVGYGEVGPWGSSRTRWEMESYGEFSLEGCVELAWLLGYIRYHHGPIAGKDHHIGWVDAISNEPVRDVDVKARYEATMLGQCGVRVVDPASCYGYNPYEKQYFHQVALERTTVPIEVSNVQEAHELSQRVGASVCDIFQRQEDGVWCVQFKRGCTVIIPRALTFDRFHAAQIPTGWSAARLGIPQDIIDRVDPVVLYTLVSTVEALLSAGVTDPYEFYKYVHVTDVGNCRGGGMGGVHSLATVFHKRYMEHNSLPVDIMQETFVNTASAWVNMLLLSSSGPIRTPVGACATAAESVEIGADTILRGKALVVIVGGSDDFCEESAFEFAAMQATSSSKIEQAMGRDPREMSRPCSSTRGGFMESHGAGNQVLMTADLALKMGVPIYAIVAHSATATDKEGRSVPAPGQGILTTAREEKSSFVSPLLSLDYRRRRLMEEFARIESVKEAEIHVIEEEAQAMREECRALFVASRREHLDRHLAHKRQSAQKLWGTEFYHNERHLCF